MASNRIEKYFKEHKKEKVAWNKFNKLASKKLFLNEKCYKCKKTGDIKYACILAKGINTSGENAGNGFLSHFLLREHGFCEKCRKLKMVATQCVNVSLPIMFKANIVKPKLEKIMISWLSSVDEFLEKSKELNKEETMGSGNENDGDFAG